VSHNRDGEIPFLDLVGQHAALKDELMAAFAAAVDSGGFVGGPAVERFEAQWAEAVGVRHAVGVSSGTDALAVALRACGIGRGDAVVTVANTFIATAEAISLVGARFELVDCTAESCLMDPQVLSDHLKRRFASPSGPRIRAVVPVHLYGQCADMDAIAEVAGRYDLAVIEDAAQAHGAMYKGRAAGSLGTAAAFSFYPGKNLGACGEGGAITTDDEQIGRTARLLRDHGQAQKYRHDIEGGNWRMHAIQAAILSVKLPHLQAWNESRRQVASRLSAGLAEIPGVQVVRTEPGNLPVYHLFVIKAPRRDQLREFLAERGIASGLHYPVPVHQQPCYRLLALGPFVHAERWAQNLISLPIFPGMSVDQTDQVIGAVRAFYA
jgi:dTDP-4-amino-4,6-dideoxygalactose transaminase